MRARQNPRRSATAIVALLLLASLGACDKVKELVSSPALPSLDRPLGERFCTPNRETAPWVLKQALDAAGQEDTQESWQTFEKMLHSSQRTPDALQRWRTSGWQRLRRRSSGYVDGKGCFKVVDIEMVMNDSDELIGMVYAVADPERVAPGTCALYADAGNGNRWRIKECEL